MTAHDMKPAASDSARLEAVGGRLSRVDGPAKITGGADYAVESGALVFERELRKDKISGWRWFLGAWGVGTYRQHDSVDVRYTAADGSPKLAEGLDIEPSA